MTEGIHETANIHPGAIVEEGARIGEGCVVGPFCHIGPEVVLGARVELECIAVVREPGPAQPMREELIDQEERVERVYRRPGAQ